LSIADELKFFYFHHHHYSHLPADIDGVEATWVTYPNSRYDPVLGHELYKRHLLIDEQPAVIEAMRAFAKSAAVV